MQCFQKDPNLRVSARKLLKHPWIVSAKRSDGVVPNKPTEYDEAVKSVQEWNEALKSPNAGSLRRASRPMSSSPVPGRREVPISLSTPAKGPVPRAKSKVNPEQFRSPSGTADDNWDSDFDTAISPRALQLPHLRPQDNFGGLLSSERLKQFASFESPTGEAHWNNNTHDGTNLDDPSRITPSDPLETIRPSQAKRADIRHRKSSNSKPFPSKSQSKVSGENVIPPNIHQSDAISLNKQPTPSALSYTETEDEDYSDIIADDETIFKVKIGIKKVFYLQAYLQAWLTFQDPA